MHKKMNHSPLRVAIHGAAGRMGQALIQAMRLRDDLCLSAAIEHTASPLLGQMLNSDRFTQATDDAIIISADLDAALTKSDVLIDFTRPEPCMQALAAARRHGIPMVIGTTGLTPTDKQQLNHAAAEIPIVFASNFSIGVNLCLSLLATAAKTLGDDYDVEIIEAHHHHKVDAPSGTALSMGEAVATARGRVLSECATYARQGHTGEREVGTIGFATIRGGDIVGDHTVLFAGEGERVEITHKASSRATFAHGALTAAAWVCQQPAALYDMQDVLALTR